MARGLLPVGCTALLLLGGCGPGQKTADAPPASVFQHRVDPALLDGDRAFREMEAFLAVGPRVSGQPAARKAAEHIAARLKAHGLDAAIDTFSDTTPAGPVDFHNVIGTRAGATPGLIILGGHFDTKAGIAGDFIGANDSGSSTGLLLELARVYGAAEWKGPTLLFAFFDGEEARFTYSDIDGLHGSRRLARKLKEDGRAGRVLAMINLDMIGDRDLTIQVPADTPPRLARIAFAAAENLALRSRIGYSQTSILDDHVPFQRIGIPAIDLIDFQYGSKPGLNDYWHTPADTVDKLSPGSLSAAGRITIEMVNLLLSGAHAGP